MFVKMINCLSIYTKYFNKIGNAVIKQRRKAETVKTKLFSSIMAGSYIALGALTYLSVSDPVAAALLFSTGIFLVFNFCNMLFTKVCPLSVVTKEYKIIDCVIAWVGNGIGAFIVATLVHFTRMEGKISEKLTSIGEVKLTDNPLSLYIMGFFCAVLVTYAVLIGLKYATGSLPQIIFVWLFITAFVFCGFEHVVANMYYLFSYAWLNGIDVSALLINLVCVTAGNITGGLLIGYLEAPKVTKSVSLIK